MSDSIDIQSVTLRPGVDIPLLGLGTWQANEGEAYQAVRDALELGYRHIDTARGYGNEVEVGKAVADSGLARDDVFITTKLPPNEADQADQIIDESLERLGVDHVDLWLIHWPPDKQARPDVWQRVLAAQEAGKARAVGVSNYSLAQIDELISVTGIAPSINQIPWSPADFNADLLAGHAERDIVVEGYSPFKRTNLDDPVLSEIAAELGVTTTAVVLRWHLDTGVVAIPKSVNKDRIAANLQLDFRLSAEQIERVNALSTQGE